MKAKNIITALGLTLAMTLTTNAQFSITTCPSHEGGQLLGGLSTINETTDFLLTMLDASGDVMWERTYGGDKTDELTVVKATFDGGYIIGGRSNSGISGDKSDPLLGDYDTWLVKIDGNGNLEWDGTYGGSEKDNLVAIEQQADGVIILAGYTDSNSSLFHNRESDYFAIWIDKTGRVINEEKYQQKGKDILSSMTLLNDGSILLSGYTRSSKKNEFESTLLKVDQGGSAEWVEYSDEVFAEVSK